MRSLKYFFTVVIISLSNVTSFGQGLVASTDEPTAWQYEVKKKSATEYQLIFHLDLKQGWHIWSVHPGGDGYEIAPTFTFDKNAMVILKGKTAEKGKAETTKMEGITGKVTRLSGKVDYIQEVIVKGKTTIKGKHTFQVCNDRMCLPPKDKEFAFDIQ